MSERYLHRIVVVLAITMVVSGAVVFNASAASASSSTSTRPVLQFDDAANQAELVIPSPACPTWIPKCQWMLYMNLPMMPNQPRVGFVVGRHGVLVIPYPKFCGVIQADALVGPRSDSSTWVYQTGIREHIGKCGHPGTTTTTTSDPEPTTTTTTDPVVEATTTTPPTPTTDPAVVAAKTTTPSEKGTTSALPFTDAASPTSTVARLVAAQLPFTGIDPKPLAILGSTLVILGGLLLTTVESRRRMLRRATAIRLESVKDGARQTSSWFLGL